MLESENTKESYTLDERLKHYEQEKAALKKFAEPKKINISKATLEKLSKKEKTQ